MDADDQAESPFLKLEQTFVATSSARTAITAIKRLHRHGIRNGESGCLTVIGPSRVGKSTVLRRYAMRYPPTRHGRQLIRPVLIVRAPPSNADSALLTATLAALGDPNPASGTPTEREMRVVNHLGRQCVELLCFDEVNHLIDSDSDKIGYRAANLIKALLNYGVCPIVLTGVTHAKRIVDTNEQLQGRSRPTVTMRPLDWRNQNQRLEFKVFLHQLEKAMALPAPSQLGEDSLAHRIHHFSRGLPGYALDLLAEALIYREEAGNVAPCLTLELLREAADGLLLREPVRRLNALREDPPDSYEPAPMFDALKAASRPAPKRKSGIPSDLLD